MNIAEGNGKGTSADRRCFFEIAPGSALESGQSSDIETMRCGRILTAMIDIDIDIDIDYDNDYDNGAKGIR